MHEKPINDSAFPSKGADAPPSDYDTVHATLEKWRNYQRPGGSPERDEFDHALAALNAMRRRQSLPVSKGADAPREIWKTTWHFESGWCDFQLIGTPTAAELDDIEQLIAIQIRGLRRHRTPASIASSDDGMAKASMRRVNGENECLRNR